MKIDELAILWRDEYLVAIDKPPGIHVHRSEFARQEDNCTRILRDQLNQHIFPIHRLDRATSGVLLFSLDKDMTRELSMQFADRKVGKRYHAVVRGYLPEEGLVDRPLKESPEKAPADAQTAFRKLAGIELPEAIGKFPTTRYSFAEILPSTGRRHQIRRHLAGISHPIICDTIHGDGKHNRFFRERYGVEHLLLFATRLSFRHPLTDETILIESAVPQIMQRIAAEFDWPLWRSLPRD